MRNEDRDDEPRVLPTTDARQGASTHVTRYALGWGLVLVIAAFILIYLIFAHKHS